MSISSIVEGADYGVEPIVLDENDVDISFWKTLEVINQEACRIWEKENSDWIYIYDPKLHYFRASCHWVSGDVRLTWDDDDLSSEEKIQIEEGLKKRWKSNKNGNSYYLIPKHTGNTFGWEIPGTPFTAFQQEREDIY